MLPSRRIAQAISITLPKLINFELVNTFVKTVAVFFSPSSQVYGSSPSRVLFLFRTCLQRIDTCYRGQPGPLAVTMAPWLVENRLTLIPRTELWVCFTVDGYFGFALVLSQPSLYVFEMSCTVTLIGRLRLSRHQRYQLFPLKRSVLYNSRFRVLKDELYQIFFGNTLRNKAKLMIL